MHGLKTYEKLNDKAVKDAEGKKTAQPPANDRAGKLVENKK